MGGFGVGNRNTRITSTEVPPKCYKSGRVAACSIPEAELWRCPISHVVLPKHRWLPAPSLQPLRQAMVRTFAQDLESFIAVHPDLHH